MSNSTSRIWVRRGMAMGGLHRQHFVLDDGEQSLARAQDVEIIGDLGGQLVQGLRRFRRGRGAVRRCRRRSRMARACASDRRQLPSSSMPWRGSAISAISGAMSCGRPGAVHQAPRAPSPASAEVRIRRMTSSILATAMARPTRIWARVARLAEHEVGAPGDDLLAEVDEGLHAIAADSGSRAGRRSAPAC